MQYATVSDLKQNAANLNVKEGPITITQNGNPVYVIQSFSDFKRQEAITKEVLRMIQANPTTEADREAQALVSLLNISSEEFKNGNHCSAEELIDSLKEKFNGDEAKKPDA